MRIFSRILLAFICISLTHVTVFGASLTFLKIYQGSGSSYGLQTSSISITTPVLGSNFRFTSANPAAVEFSGNNVAGQLSYIHDGNQYYINGAVTRKEGNSGNKGFYFVETTVLGNAVTTGRAWFFLVPGMSVTENSSIGTNSAPPAGELNDFLATQSSNDAPLITSNGGGASASISINEGATVVATVSSTDADGTTNQTYSISGGVDAAKFSIVAATGVLTITAQDYENPTDAGRNNTYEVQVTVTDAQGATDVQLITVNVLDVNDNSPIITSNGGGAAATVYVTAGTTSVTDNDATDADGDVLTFAISNVQIWDGSAYVSTTNPFQINSSTGALAFTSNASVNKYQITVTVSDGSTTDTQVLTVEVTSTDTQAPTLDISASDNNLSSGEVTTVYFQFSETIKNFDASDLTVVGGTLGTLYQDANDPTLYYATFTQTGTSPSVSVASNSYQDNANNNGTGDSINFSLDTLAPGVTVEISTIDISYGGTRTVTFTFTEDPGLTFSLSDILVANGSVSNLVQTGTATVWTATLQSTSSVSGPTVTVTAGSYRDAAGNSGSSGTDSATLAPPAIDLANTSSSDTGESSTDNYTSNTKPLVVGTTPTGVTTATIVITQGATTYTFGNVTVSNQQFSLDLSTATVTTGTAFPSGGLTNGTIGLQVTLSDASTASSSFIVDTSAPTVPTVSSNTTDNSTPTIVGTATVGENDKLVLLVNGVTYVEGDGNLTINRTANTWSLVIPTSNALSAATYSVLATVTDLAGNSNNDTSTGELVISPKVSQADGTWSTTGSWNNGTIPVETSPVQIQHHITIPSGTVNTNTILLTAAGKLTNQGTLTINGNLVLSVDENSNSSQFLNTGTVVNNGKIVIRKKFTKNKWYYMSFPFDVPSNQILRTGTKDTVSWGNHDDSFDSQIYIAAYDGAARASSGTVQTSSSNWKRVSPRVLKARHGYFIAMDTNSPFDEVDFVSVAGLSAPLNNEFTASEVYKNTSGTYGDLHSHWNLVGLPYLSSFDLSQGQSFKPYYIYNNSNFFTVAEGDSRVVKPFSAFYLQAHGVANSLSFASAGRTIQALPAFNMVDEFKLSLTYGDMTDETRIRFVDEGTLDYQLGLDATKMFSPVSIFPQIYSFTNDVNYSLNALPQETQQSQLKMRFGAAGIYTIQLENVADIDQYKVVLTDKLSNIDVDLIANPEYQFQVDQKGNSDRFVVHFLSKVVSGTNDGSIVNQRVVVEDRKLIVSQLPERSNLILFDLSGKILQTKTNVVSETVFEVAGSGIYFLHVQNQFENKPYKVFVN